MSVSRRRRYREENLLNPPSTQADVCVTDLGNGARVTPGFMNINDRT